LNKILKTFGFFIITLLLTIGASCNKSEEDYINIYKKSSISINEVVRAKDQYENLYKNNSINLKNGYPFYILRNKVPLFLERPSEIGEVPKNYIFMNFGDILFPVKTDYDSEYYYFVKTINNEFGWINTGFGISLNYNEDENLYYFSDKHYLKNYVLNKGDVIDSDKIVLIKNVVPMLLNNFQTDGWFYPTDYKLALELSKYGLNIATDQNTYFHVASAYDWKVNEVIIIKNLIADSYQKLGFLDESIKIHESLIQSQNFWKRSDNSQIGGLNSIVKLEKILLDKLSLEKEETKEYDKIKKYIIDIILKMGDQYSHFGVLDKNWRYTASEWALDILRENVSSENFFNFCEILMKRTVSEGFADLVLVYKALELYKTGDQNKALEIFSSLKPKKKFTRSLNIDDWLSANQVAPESFIYQYSF